MQKTVLILVILFLLVGVGGYFGVNFLLEKETTTIKADLQDLKIRLQKIEEESKLAPLQPDADVQRIIQMVNSIYHKVNGLEESLNKNVTLTEESFKKQSSSFDEAIKKQSQEIENTKKELMSSMQDIIFKAEMANIRTHILKVRDDLQNRNVGIAKAELDLISEAFGKIKSSTSDGNKKIIEEMQSVVKKTKSEIDIDLPAAINKIDLLWHETSKLIRKG